MDRFAAMLWDADDLGRFRQVNAWSEALQRASARWTRVLDAPGLRVFSLIQRGETPIVTRWSGADGVVVGPLFRRGAERNGRVSRLERDEAERAVETGGANLIADFWGNYVALWRDQANRRIYALRDPCGAVPCFMTHHNGVDLLFSHADDAARLPGLSFTIDWTYLQAFILFNYFVTKHTGLKEVKELLGGERLEWDARDGNRFSFLWNGAHIAARPNLQSFENAKAELRETAEACFAAWGKEYRNIVVSLSGGLDSSILANLLRRVSEAKITGLHYLGVGYEQYEVKLARLAAAHAGIELIEGVQDPAKDEVRRILDSPRLARPKVQSLAVLIDDLSVQAAERVGADCFMIGQGGDNLFLQRGGAKQTLADYVRLRGLGRDFWRVAYEAAMLQQRPIWTAMGDAFANVMLPRAWRAFAFLENEDWVKHRPLPPNALADLPDDYKNHPWYADAASLPRGKADHLVSIVALYNYYIHFQRGITRDVSYPYISQPITEWALRTPTFVLAHEGLDRAVERRAFADIIPEQITRRTGKGGADHYLLQVMQRNFDFYRDLIMDGALIGQDWFDRARIERMLSPEFAAHGGGAIFVYLLVSVEAWLKTWRDNSASIAAA